MSVSQSLVATVYKALRNYRMTNMGQEDEPSEAYPLVDLVSLPGTTIATGEEELGEIAYAVAEAITRAETPQSIPSEREEIVAWIQQLARDTAWNEPTRVTLSYVANAIARGEHLSTRQAPIEGSVK